MKMNKKADTTEVMIWAILIIAGLCLVASLFIILPLWSVWSSGLSGKAQLKEAEWNRQIEIEEARAELESADLKRQSDVIRAEGVAEANNIISKSLTPEYITWKWVEGLHDGSSEVIYVPTEANIPILEVKPK